MNLVKKTPVWCHWRRSTSLSPTAEERRRRVRREEEEEEGECEVTVEGEKCFQKGSRTHSHPRTHIHTRLYLHRDLDFFDKQDSV